MKIEATGHLIDSGLFGKALDVITAGGGTYEVTTFELGRSTEEESRVVLELTAEDRDGLEAILANLGALGFSPPDVRPAELARVEKPGVAPTGFYSTTNLATRVYVEDAWVTVQRQRMDAVVVVAHSGGNTSARCVKLRDLHVGDDVVVGHGGVQVTPDTKVRDAADFAFMSSEISSERRVEQQVRLLAGRWRTIIRGGGRVVLVAGPVLVHSGQAQALASIIRRGYVSALLAGNALAVHDIEAAVLGTSLGVAQDTGQPVLHGHMNHMRAINLVRASGSIAKAVADGRITRGIMHALTEANVPYCLAGSIRDDGPIPDTEMDLIRAQDQYAELLDGAELVIVLGTMLHGIGTGNMLPASTQLVCVDINPAVAAKLSDRGSSHTTPVVTDVGLFVATLARVL